MKNEGKQTSDSLTEVWRLVCSSWVWEIQVGVTAVSLLHMPLATACPGWISLCSWSCSALSGHWDRYLNLTIPSRGIPWSSDTTLSQLIMDYLPLFFHNCQCNLGWSTCSIPLFTWLSEADFCLHFYARAHAHLILGELVWSPKPVEDYFFFLELALCVCVTSELSHYRVSSMQVPTQRRWQMCRCTSGRWLCHLGSS